MSTPAHAATPPLNSAERAYVGEYVQAEKESRAQIALLDDRTFCFSFMGGSVDALVAGHWHVAADGKSIRLEEVKAQQPLFPAMAQLKAGSKQVVFEFDGYSLSNAKSPVFATSSSDAEPARLRPLFGDRSSWAERYPLPAMAAANARYFFIGRYEDDRSATAGVRPASQRVKVLQYEISGAANVLVGFIGEQALIDMSQPVSLVGDRLQLGPQLFGRRQPISAELAEQVREACIRPMFAQAAEKPGAQGEGGRTMLVPVKTFYVDPSRVQGAPWIPGTGW